MLAHPCELLIFDWDGTVVDSTPTITQAILSACRDVGVDVPDAQEASWVIGLGLQDALSRVAPDLSQSRQAQLVERFRFHYLSQDKFLRPFPGMVEIFEQCRTADIPLAVTTGKSRVGLERAFEATGTRHFFQTSRCADESDPKPAPTMVLEICKELSIEPHAALVIGDTTHDILMAKSAGAPVLAVGYGAHRAEELLAAEPIDCMASVPQLNEWISTWITIR